MAEWSKAAVLKTAVPQRVPWVRIPLHPFDVNNFQIITYGKMQHHVVKKDLQSMFFRDDSRNGGCIIFGGNDCFCR